MATPSFRRSATWSTATAVDRIERTLARARHRRAEIASETSRLGAESADLGVLITQLESLLEVETASRDRKRSASRATVPDQITIDMSPTTDAVVSVDLSVAANHSHKREYHREGRFFLPKGQRRFGSTAARRYQIPDEGCDPEILRLVKMIEVPGLIHAMVMAEKAQQVIDVDAVVVPEDARGINLAEGYRDHVFSVEAFSAFTDPSKAGGYLAQLQAGFIPPSEP